MDNKLKTLIKSGELAIIPIGFRCFTKIELEKRLGLNQQSFPFDSGFFPPSSVASIFKTPEINMSIDDPDHAVCIKYEKHKARYLDETGVKFQRTTYDEIDRFAESDDVDDINKYLDTSRAYYTYDPQHEFILAHYNWHKSAPGLYSKHIYDPKLNIENINKKLNKRIKEMFDACDKAFRIFFTYSESQKYEFMMIDSTFFLLNNLYVVKRAAREVFGKKASVVMLDEIDTPEKALGLYYG